MYALARCLALAAVAAALPESPAAHQAETGWRYDAWCCGGNDCRVIGQDQVKITPDGYLVSIPEGSHPTARQDHLKLFAYDRVQRSGDQQFHACIVPYSQDFRCLYVPDFTY